MKIDYHNKMFKASENSDNGEVSDKTLFQYYQEGQLLRGSYEGGNIAKGELLGKVLANGQLQFYYHHILIDGQLQAGYCESKPEIMPNGRIKLYESWQWFSGDGTRGHSTLEEVEKTL
ncbi:hypothetical protein [Membranihabitans marinus]|uniref:hypothetical protein n=1 Tax=Membranihabitans marinus TaxID=1227546 RepID=UPI001F2B95FC|nr:hypothetical protein [Membranihabitans marinus]